LVDQLREHEFDEFQTALLEGRQRQHNRRVLLYGDVFEQRCGYVLHNVTLVTTALANPHVLEKLVDQVVRSLAQLDVTACRALVD
jgi:hypothetical protein